MRKVMKKRIYNVLCFILCVVLVFTSLDISAFAMGTNYNDDECIEESLLTEDGNSEDINDEINVPGEGETDTENEAENDITNNTEAVEEILNEIEQENTSMTECVHDFDEKTGICKLCDYHCSHDSLAQGLGTCEICGLVHDEHYYTGCEQVSWELYAGGEYSFEPFSTANIWKSNNTYRKVASATWKLTNSENVTGTIEWLIYSGTIDDKLIISLDDEIIVESELFYYLGKYNYELTPGTHFLTAEFSRNSTESPFCSARLALPDTGQEHVCSVCGNSEAHTNTEYKDCGNGTHCRICAVCQSVDSSFEAEEHPYYDNTQFSISDNGMHCWVCSRCGANASASHNFVAEIVTKEALKSEANCGSDSIYYKSCNECGFKSTNEEDTFSVAGTATGNHGSNLVAVSENAATCTASGNIAYWHCEACNHNYEDEYGETELSDEDIIIPQLLHAWNTYYSVDVEPTEESNGQKSIHCSLCDAIKEGSRVVVTYEDKLNGNISDYVLGDCISSFQEDNITWGLYDSNYDSKYDTLVVSGNGAIKDYTAFSTPAPWQVYNNSIERIIIENGITSVGNYAFYGYNEYKNLKEVIIGDSVEQLGDFAFNNNGKSIKKLTIPITTKMESSSFGDNKISQITLTKGNGTRNDLSNYDALHNPWNIYQNDSVSISINIAEGVEYIGNCAFYKASMIKFIHFPSTLKTIGKKAFYECTGLSNIEIPANVTTIEEEAFYFGFSNLSDVHIYFYNPFIDIEYDKKTIYPNLVIHGYKTSTTEDYAIAFSKTFVAMDIDSSMLPSVSLNELAKSVSDPLTAKSIKELVGYIVNQKQYNLKNGHYEISFVTANDNFSRLCLWLDYDPKTHKILFTMLYDYGPVSCLEYNVDTGEIVDSKIDIYAGGNWGSCTAEGILNQSSYALGELLTYNVRENTSSCPDEDVCEEIIDKYVTAFMKVSDEFMEESASVCWAHLGLINFHANDPVNSDTDYLVKGEKKKLDYPDYKNYTFVSSDKKIATVSKKGIITAKKAGKVTITVTSKLTGNIDCYEYTVDAPKFSAKTYYIFPGESVAVELIDTKLQNFATYSISKTDKVQLNGNKVSGIKKGSVTVTAVIHGKKFKTKVTVEQAKIDKTYVRLMQNDEKVKLKISGTKRKVFWVSSNTDVATVDDKGNVVVGDAVGNAIITAVVGTKEFTCSVRVK